MPNEPSGQVAAPTQGTARVRFEFAGRAHRREFTPKLEIKRKENKVKEKEEKFEKKKKEFTTEGHKEERGSGRGIPRVLLRRWPWWRGTGGISWFGCSQNLR